MKKQGNVMSQREQSNTLIADYKESEIDAMPDKEFKRMIAKILRHKYIWSLNKISKLKTDLREEFCKETEILIKNKTNPGDEELKSNKNHSGKP